MDTIYLIAPPSEEDINAGRCMKIIDGHLINPAKCAVIKGVKGVDMM